MLRKTKCCLLASAILAGAGFLAAPASADDLFSGATTLDAGQLGDVAINDSILYLNNVKQNATVKDNTTVNLGTMTNGDIAANVISQNRGLTAVLANTGNNVSMNYTTILNLNIQ